MPALITAEELPPPWRLALAYAPKRARDPWRALLALDWRLSQAVGQSREPLLAQMRLAWWRERLGEVPEAWPAGEPTLAALASWGPHASSLVKLADGWEAMLADPPRPDLLAEARGVAMAALADLLGEPEAAVAAKRAAVEWSLAETGDMKECQPISLPKVLRPLIILRMYHQYRSRGLIGFFKILSAGLLGR